MSPEEFAYIAGGCYLKLSMLANNAALTRNRFNWVVDNRPERLKEWLEDVGSDSDWISRFRLDFERGHFD